MAANLAGKTLLLLCDETNLDPASVGVEFFVYGGLVVPAENAWTLHQRIMEIRERHGFQDGDLLKWGTRSRPHHVDTDSWNVSKGEVLAAAAELGCSLQVVLIHHNIAKDAGERHTFQMNTLARSFNSICGAQDAAGMVLIDRVDGRLDEFGWMNEKLSSGLTWPHSDYSENLGRIVLYGVTSVNASHLPSALDVALGAFGYCVNERRPDRLVPRQLMPKIEPLLQGRRDPQDGTIDPQDGTIDPLGSSLLLNPQRPTAYAHEYVSLLEHVEDLADNIRIRFKKAPYA